MSRIYAGTSDVALRDKAIGLMTEFGKTISKYSSGHYGYDKFVCGLVDVACFTGNQTGWPILEELTHWAEKHLGRQRLPATDADSQGGFFNGELEWYTLPENLYRAQQISGNTMYGDFAKSGIIRPTGTCSTAPDSPRPMASMGTAIATRSAAWP